MKVDRQVIAVARVEGATKIYADDYDLVAFARRLGMDAVSTWDLPLPEQVQDLFTVAGVPEQPPGPEVEDEVDQSVADDPPGVLDEVDVDDILRQLEPEPSTTSDGEPGSAPAPAAEDAVEERQNEAELHPPREG